MESLPSASPGTLERSILPKQVTRMPNWSYLIARLISAIGSWLDASNLRNRVFRLQQENELLRVALDDIQRMDPEGRLGWYAKQALERADLRD